MPASRLLSQFSLPTVLMIGIGSVASLASPARSQEDSFERSFWEVVESTASGIQVIDRFVRDILPDESSVGLGSGPVTFGPTVRNPMDWALEQGEENARAVEEFARERIRGIDQPDRKPPDEEAIPDTPAPPPEEEVEPDVPPPANIRTRRGCDDPKYADLGCTMPEPNCLTASELLAVKRGLGLPTSCETAIRAYLMALNNIKSLEEIAHNHPQMQSMAERQAAQWRERLESWRRGAEEDCGALICE